MDRRNNCVVCTRSVLRRRKHILTELFLERYRSHTVLLLQEIIPREIPFDGTRSICHPCWQRFDRAVHNQHAPNIQVDQEIAVEGEGRNSRREGILTIPGYLRASNTARRCIFQNCRNTVTRCVPLYARFYLLHNHNLYVPNLARACQPHIMTNDWDILANGQIILENFNSAHVLDLINLYRWGYERRNQMDFENIEEFDDDELHFWTSLSKSQFSSILRQTPSLRVRSDCPATVLGVYLVKIRTGESDERLASKFNMSRRTFERKLQIARQCLTEDFMPLYLGLDHLTRDNVVSRNLSIPSHIFGGDENENGIFVMDGTYLYVQKSSNFLFQRKTYSLHKFRNLVKPFLVVCTDGYIIDVVGPYPATTSDASILRHLLENIESPWHWFLRPNDIFILDRGFRDSIPIIEECGYVPHMPPSRGRGEQLTTLDANKSRLITMCRWVVEAINGRFKKDFKIFRHTYFNVAMRNMMTDFKITAAIINATRRPYEDSVYVDQFINIINGRMNRENELAQHVIENNMNRQRVAFMPLDGNNPDFRDFPQLTFEELILFTLGSYHLRLARSYCHEHIRPNGVYMIELYRHQELINNKILIRGRIQSRHVRARQYYTYILINPATQGRQSVEDYYCSCIHGRRTVGSCAHIASIVYFLSWARHQQQIEAPAVFLDDITVDIDHAE